MPAIRCRILAGVGASLLIAALAAGVAPAGPLGKAPQTRDDIGAILAPARAALSQARRQLAAGQWGRDGGAQPRQMRLHADLLIEAGHPDAALRVLEQIPDPDLSTRLATIGVLLQRHDYQDAAPLIHALARQYPENAEVRQELYAWWSIRNDLQRVEDVLHVRSGDKTLAPADRLAEADIDLGAGKYPAAYLIYTQLQGDKSAAASRAAIVLGLGMTEFDLRQYAKSLGTLQEALRLDPSNASTVTAIASVLLRVGRVGDAITALRLALDISPWNLDAHALLGNGYTRLDYTQLHSAFPAAFSSGAPRAELLQGDDAWSSGNFPLAEEKYLDVAQAHPGWADAEARLGSLAYIQGHYRAARGYFWRAYRICPQYGRANDGLASALEALAYRVSIYRQHDKQALREQPMPPIPGIEKYVINWKALPASYQKRVALSLRPWVRYIPALEAGGATLYIKPLWQRLSQAPFLGKLRNQRISYDSRLWDDVRGEGGHHVVVSDQDIVTRSNGGFDTLLHEVSHQVNAILSPAWDRKIDALYSAATRRQAAAGHAFIDQYSASSVLEYFAQGAVAASNHRRNAYDLRKIVYGRLKKRDPALLALELEIMRHADVRPSFAMSLVSQGDDYLWRGKLARADASYAEALLEDPGNVLALSYRIHTLVLMHRLKAAQALADEAVDSHPDSGSLVSAWAQVRWLRGAPVEHLIAALERKRLLVKGPQRYRVNVTIGRIANYAGQFVRARDSFARVLAYQPQNADALQGMGSALFSQGSRAEAWKYFARAARVRSGVASIHVTYGRDLLRAGHVRRAMAQVRAALLVDPNDPDALGLEAWADLEAGNVGSALRTARQACALGPWSTLAAAVLAAAQARQGDLPAAHEAFQAIIRRWRLHAPPRYVYRKSSGQYVLGFTASAADWDLVKTFDPRGPAS